jgi:hypothetical protein
MVRSQSTDNTSHFIIAAELAPEEIALSSSDLKGTLREGDDPLFSELPDFYSEEALKPKERTHSRLPWRNPPNPMPRPRKFEKKTHLSPHTPMDVCRPIVIKPLISAGRASPQDPRLYTPLCDGSL